MQYLGFMVCLVYLNCLVGYFNMIVWTPVLSVLYACVSQFCICPCSAQLSMFHMERCSKNTLIIIIITCSSEKKPALVLAVVVSAAMGMLKVAGSGGISSDGDADGSWQWWYQQRWGC